MAQSAADAESNYGATPTARLKKSATKIGFDLIGIAPAVAPVGWPRFQSWLEAGYFGEMEYLPRREQAYEHPNGVMPGVRSIVVVAWNYHQSAAEPLRASEGRYATYAQSGVDYHDLLRQKLQELAARLKEIVPGCRTRSAVDTAPLLERDYGRLAGLGWFGKNTMLINKGLGSFFFLGALLTDAELEFDAPHETSHCGTCTRCLDICPTRAFPEPGVLDATKCISYLTIEHKSSIDPALRSGMEDWLFGCDLCQDVCPWNRKAPLSSHAEYQSEHQPEFPSAANLLRMSSQDFARRFDGTPLKRTGYSRLSRNAAIVLGNTGTLDELPLLQEAANSPDALVAEAAQWAMESIKNRSRNTHETGQ